MRILVVEDHPKLARAIARGLEQERFAVDVVFDGDSGLASGRESVYDAIILDRMLPGKSGTEIIKTLRSEGVHTPIMLLTAKDSVADKVEGLNSGADDYLVKPFELSELLARLRALLRRPAVSQNSKLAYRDLILDPNSFLVTRASRDISLTNKEFALLEYLMMNAEQTVSKQQIIDHVWNFDADILPNTLEVFIGYLRAKIDKPFPKNPLIHTKRGFGYCLEGK